jgi:hypothetical protein
MAILQGYEKAWAALLGGGMMTSATTVALWAASLNGAVSVPDEAMIVAAISGIVTSIFAALGALIATNTQGQPPEAVPPMMDATPVSPPEDIPVFVPGQR